MQSIGLDIKVLSEDAQEIMIQDTDDDINETAKELELDVTGVDPNKDQPAAPKTTTEDSYEGNDDSADEDDDIIAELGNMGNTEERPEDAAAESGTEDDNSDK